MAPVIKNVALVGATGNVGAPVLHALRATGRFNITVLVRPDSTRGFPDGISTKQVDLNSFDSVVEALRGQDAAIIATSIQDPAIHTQFVDAAVAAGVYRLIPSDFGMNPETCLGPELPVFAVKAATLERLREVTSRDDAKLTWTIVTNGPFLDWNMATGFLGIDVKAKKAQIMSGGATQGAHTTLRTIGQAVAGILLHPEETRNRSVKIQSVVKDQNELLALAKRALGDEGWEVTEEDSTERYQWAMEELGKGNYDAPVWMYQIRYITAEPKFAQTWDHSDNELLGLNEMSDEEVVEMIKTLVTEDRTAI